MTRFARFCSLSLPAAMLAAALLSGNPIQATPAAAQDPAGNPAQGQPAPGQPGARAPQKPKNLKVLPENTDLRRVMREYSGALGVECEYCHAAPDPVTHRSDRASDANPMKDNARVMITMTDDLNKKYLPLLANRKDSDTIGCGTCHRGQTHPAAFVAPPRAERNRPAGGPPAAPGSGPALPPSVVPPGMAPSTTPQPH